MFFKGGLRENKIYIIISLIVIVIIILALFFSSNHLFQAYIDDEILGENWVEDIDERYFEERLFGLEKQGGYTYKISESYDDTYSAFLTVTSIKTLLMMSEDELFEKTVETIKESAKSENIIINQSSSISGSRYTNNGDHKTKYVIYEGEENISGISETVMIIGECWNCAASGSSIICIGFAQITDNENNNPIEYMDNWAKIVSDKGGTFVNGDEPFIDSEGLIFNVICH